MPGTAAAGSVRVVPHAGVDRPRLMVIIGFLAYNTAIGMGFGAYGTLVSTIQREFATTRTLAVSGLSVMALMIGLISPLLGGAMQRFGIRWVMIAGALMCAAGYAALAFTRDIYVLLGAFVVLLGPGAALCGPVPASTLVTNWVDPTKRGKALGFVTMPLFVCFFPFIVSALLPAIGLSAVFLVLALLMVALVPVLLAIRDRPRVVVVVSGHGSETVAAVSLAVAPLSTRAILRRPAFFVLALGSSLVVATGMIMTSHLVSIGLWHGLTLGRASLLLSAFGISGAAGAVLFGWFADKAGVRTAFATVALLPVAAVFCLMGKPGLALMLLAAGLLGMSCSAVTALQGAGAAAWLGKESFARSSGLIFLFQVPFLFGSAPLAGYLYDRSGSYDAPLILVMAILGFAGAMFLVFRPARLAV